MVDPRISPLTLVDADRLARIHATGFQQAWSAMDFLSLISGGASGRALTDSGALVGLLLWRVVADEAEILTIAVKPDYRRRGAGRCLLNGALQALSGDGVDRVFLEVAEDNPAAIQLYRSAGFATVGRRKGYYRRDVQAVDAQVLQLKLNTEGH